MSWRAADRGRLRVERGRPARAARRVAGGPDGPGDGSARAQRRRQVHARAGRRRQCSGRHPDGCCSTTTTSHGAGPSGSGEPASPSSPRVGGCCLSCRSPTTCVWRRIPSSRSRPIVARSTPSSCSRSSSSAGESPRGRSPAASSRWSCWRRRSCRSPPSCSSTSCRWDWHRSSSSASFPSSPRSPSSGVGVLLIEQFAHVALGLAQGAHILQGGRIRYSGTARELQDDPELLHSAYLLGV